LNRSSRRSPSLPYTLLFCQIIVFSFAAAWGAAWLLRAPQPRPGARPAVDRRQLFLNYRLLNLFLNREAAATGTTAAGAAAEPLLQAIAALKRAEELFALRRGGEAAAALAAVPPGFPFLEERRDVLRLRLLHAQARHAELLAFAAARPPADLQARVLRLDSLLRSGRRGEALGEFRLLFARHRLDDFRSLARADLAALLARLGEEDWRDKFADLLRANQGGEFRRLLAFSGHRDLNRLYQAEFAYASRAYGRARQLLRAPLNERFRDDAGRLLVKLDLRDNPDRDPDRLLSGPDAASLATPGLLFDIGQILLGRGEFDRALPFYERYFAAAAAPGERGDDYWKTAWLLAWIHYRRNERDEALKFFRLGSDAPVAGYRIASRYWRAKLEESAPPALHAYPFSYYAVKALGSAEGFRDLHLGFLKELDDPPGERFLGIVADLEVLARHGLWAEAAEAVHWAKRDPALGPCDLNLLKLIESILYYRQNQYYAAFTAFRGNFRLLEGVRLPNFLSFLLFPRPYEELITATSREHEVDPSLVLALIREESFFRRDARSPANAYGLMQLLQGTARQVANGSGLTVKARDLYDPEINVRLGLEYLKTLLERYDGRLYLALAAYNAGPHRVDQWRRDFPLADEEEFIEMIPFSETRNYVKNILRNYFFYRYYQSAGARPERGRDRQPS
jgi:soluble lytic murein transglycosylase-like protein